MIWFGVPIAAKRMVFSRFKPSKKVMFKSWIPAVKIISEKIPGKHKACAHRAMLQHDKFTLIGGDIVQLGFKGRTRWGKDNIFIIEIITILRVSTQVSFCPTFWIKVWTSLWVKYCSAMALSCSWFITYSTRWMSSGCKLSPMRIEAVTYALPTIWFGRYCSNA